MRKMNKKEMRELLNDHALATLCTVDAEDTPYAIEFNYFLMDGDICGLVKPGGTTARNIARNPNVCLKICRTDESCREYRAVSCFGRAAFVDDPGGVLKGWDLLEQRLKLPAGAYGKFKEKFQKKKRHYPLFRMKPERMTGVTTAVRRKEQELSGDA